MLRRALARTSALQRVFNIAAPARGMFVSSAPRFSDAKDEKPSSPEVQAIVDSILKLNVMQSIELVKSLKTTFGYSDAAFMAAPSAASAPAAAAPAAEEAKPAAPVKTTVSLKLDSFDAKDKVKIIKEVRGITGKGLKEAKELVESAPQVLKADIKKEEAEKLMAVLKEAGAICSLE